MSKIDEWITKIPRLKNAKVSRFSYKNAAYTNDDIEGVENYDYTRDMNVPSLNKTDTEASVLDSGARTQFSSLSKNALNHFFGRVSYNLNKVIDFLSDFLDDFRIQGIETVASSVSKTLPAYYSGKKVRLVNTNTTNAILFTFYAGQTFQGSSTVSIPAGRVIDIELFGTTWKDSLTGDLVGNAATSDKWKTARSITISDADGTNTGSAVSVDGSENETLKLPATIKANVTGSFTGNADTATKLADARTITIDGDATGSTTFDGSENKTITLSVDKATNATTATTAGKIPNDYGFVYNSLPEANASNHGRFIYAKHESISGGVLYYCARIASSKYLWFNIGDTKK